MRLHTAMIAVARLRARRERACVWYRECGLHGVIIFERAGTVYLETEADVDTYIDLLDRVAALGKGRHCYALAR